MLSLKKLKIESLIWQKFLLQYNCRKSLIVRNTNTVFPCEMMHALLFKFQKVNSSKTSIGSCNYTKKIWFCSKVFEFFIEIQNLLL